MSVELSLVVTMVMLMMMMLLLLLLLMMLLLLRNQSVGGVESARRVEWRSDGKRFVVNDRTVGGWVLFRTVPAVTVRPRHNIKSISISFMYR